MLPNTATGNLLTAVKLILEAPTPIPEAGPITLATYLQPAPFATI